MYRSVSILHKSSSADVTEYCPATLARLRGDYQSHYICEGNRTYEIGLFDATLCDVLPENSSFARLGQCFTDKGVVSFVGDSLTKQQYWAFKCALERHGGLNLTVTYTDTHQLRSDLPCEPECGLNTSVLLVNRGGNSKCYACNSSGKKRTRLPVAEEKWFKDLSADTRAVFIGSGSWYTPGQLGARANTTAVYAETLTTVAPALQSLVKRGVAVFWLNIPPRAATGGRAAYGWSLFEEKNTLASQTLRDLAPEVLFLNTSAATAARRTFGSSASTVGIHWCSPGRGTVPASITQHFLHALAHACPTQREHAHSTATT